MGYAIAERLARAGTRLTGYNRTRAKAEPLMKAGAQLAASPAGLAGPDIVFTMVSTAADLEAVTSGPGGVLSDAGSAPMILVDCSTVSADASARVRAAAAKRNVQFLVASVSGNDQVARAGKLRVFASGPRNAYETAAPYLACFGTSVSYIGEDDLARAVKIGHNLFLGIVYQALAECTVLAEKQGVPRHVFLEAINNSVLGSPYTRYKSPGIVNLDFTVTFSNALFLKDLDLGLEAAASHGAGLPLAGVVRDLARECFAASGGEADYTTLLLRQARASGLALQPEEIPVADGLA
jgi:3-hydroxyisobutyrate dehydrogenase-like beta-hydroxyacid dehydrogenase